MGEEFPDESREEEGEEMADEIDQCKQKKPNQFVEIAEKLIHGGLLSQVQAARDIRKLVRSCSSSASAARSRTKFVAAGVIQPLISMLAYSNLDTREASLIALLNLAVRNERFVCDRNKVKMVASGVIPPLLKLLQSRNSKLPELATAAILTLSAAAPNKLIIAASGAAPLLVQILSCGSIQGQVDAVTALYNLTTCTENPSPILDAIAVPPLISLLKECKKYSKFAGKATALLEILSNSEEGRIAITNSSGGILTLVETVEDGSLVSTEHAVGALLSLCRSCRSKYRELILQEGAIPGLLRLTVDGTVKAQEGARMLLDLLRDSPRERRIASSVLERIAYDIALRVDGPDKAAETAKKLLQDMVHTSMDPSVNCIQLRAAPSIPSEMPPL